MSAHVVETTSELSDFMKAGVMAGSERDAGFCSGGDEDDMSGLHSPSASEDSVEVQVTPISLRNKRKLAEPRKIQEPSTAPLKKRRFEQIVEETTIASSVGDEESRSVGSPSPSPFRPWSTSTSKNSEAAGKSKRVAPVQSSLTLEEARRREEESRLQEEVLSRLRETDSRQISPAPSTARTATRVESGLESPQPPSSASTSSQRHETRQRFEPPPPPPRPTAILPHPRLQEEPLSLVLRGEVPRVPAHPAVSGPGFERPPGYSVPDHHQAATTDQVLDHSRSHRSSHYQQEQQEQQQQQQQSNGQQRNYKNMTRERRIEANARERTRVHTISAAFDTLRKAIPAYSHNQKLSKLSVLRIACSYIMTLSKIATTPQGENPNGPSLGACVDLVSRTIQTEGKLRKKKDD